MVKDHIIQVVVFDDEASDTSSFVLDIERVLRPHFSVSVTQNNAFNKYFQIIVMDTVEKATFVSLDVANSPINNIDTIADFTYIAHVYMESSGNYPIDVSANAVVGDTTFGNTFHWQQVELQAAGLDKVLMENFLWLVILEQLLMTSLYL